MNTRKPPLGLLLMLAGIATPVIVLAAFKAGGDAFAKRQETALLAEPKPLAATSARVRFRSELKIEEVRGAWLRVNDGKGAVGWVFAGNLAEEQPPEERDISLLPKVAGETTATNAARPLAEAAAGYEKRRGRASAGADLHWLDQTSDAITAAQVETFLQEQKKGEYR